MGGPSGHAPRGVRRDRCVVATSRACVDHRPGVKRVKRMHDQPYSMMTANLVRPVRVLHVSPEGTSSRPDVAATEEPMEVRIDGEPFAVIMRTPGSDRELAAGFLFAE